MTKVVYASYGVFGLTDDAKELYQKYSGKDFTYDTPRHDPDLVRVVEELGRKASKGSLDIKEIEGDRYYVEPGYMCYSCDTFSPEQVIEPKDIKWVQTIDPTSN